MDSHCIGVESGWWEYGITATPPNALNMGHWVTCAMQSLGSLCMGVDPSWWCYGLKASTPGRPEEGTG